MFFTAFGTDAFGPTQDYRVSIGRIDEGALSPHETGHRPVSSRFDRPTQSLGGEEEVIWNERQRVGDLRFGDRKMDDGASMGQSVNVTTVASRWWTWPSSLCDQSEFSEL